MLRPVASRRWRATALAVLAATLVLGSVGTAQAAPAGTALDFDGNDYVTFGNPAALGLSTFTLEVWFKREGAGTGVTTSAAGGGGLTGSGAVPLLTKGRGEGDGTNVDMNWFLGIDVATSKLVVDFEEAVAGSGVSGLNHVYFGTTTIAADGVWHHAAATYDGTWHLYLDGVEEGTGPCRQRASAVGFHPACRVSDRQSPSAGAPTGVGGFFNGVIDEARVWNVARTQAEILSTKNQELTSATGLVARWGLNEGTGTSVAELGRHDDQRHRQRHGAARGLGRGLPASRPAAGGPHGADGDARRRARRAFLERRRGGGRRRLQRLPQHDVAGPDDAGNAGQRRHAVTGTRFTEAGLGNGQTYFYVVTAVDAAASQSGGSNEATATPLSTLSNGLDFDGADDHVTFGAGRRARCQRHSRSRPGSGAMAPERPPPRPAPGGGLQDAIPLVTKGRGEADNA